MKSLKTLLLGTTLTAGALFFMGTSAHADEAYTVQSGDTLSTISQKYVGDNSLIQTIAEKNSISNINLIYSGQQLTIPTGEQAATTQTAYQAPAQTKTVAEQPVKQEPVQQATPATTNTSSAKEWIAQKESSGSYTATNGRYIGRYQLDSSYLNGDYSAANQERVAEQYVSSRYGSWEAAKSFWEANGWY
ncbi:aggregation-promoting factor [Enterococcus hirae]|uniref:aggregation-promoting factor n=1 Tax=Enterococcus hirae TaxID=1354 RepID=UPI0015F26909|nr:LysM peptidoglycan-binding domain-containing protein [Enterococcus hirae]MBA5261159.1 LysM peptidoglycan-binding domain-containing protein [Enterococcus hirae]MBA5273089.1 LysM peptidoglycan-binding domain-containing protein [Enterococcus hirae]